MKCLKKWWISRYSVIDIMFRVALSGFHLRFLILDYGINIHVNLPYILDVLNPINWLIKGLFRAFLAFIGKSDRVSLRKYWILSEHKGVELEMANVCEIVTFDYHWKVHSDHWGHWIAFALAGLEVSVHFRDNRHWDYDKDAPQTPE